MDVVGCTGRMYGLAKILRTASVVVEAASIVSEYIRRHQKRSLGPPPDDVKNLYYQLFDKLYDLDSKKHKRGKDDKELNHMLQDIMTFLSLFNDDPSSLFWVSPPSHNIFQSMLVYAICFENI